MNSRVTDSDNGIGALAIPPFPVTPVFPAPVSPGQVVSSTTYGNVVRQALIDLWTDIQHVGTHASEVPATRQIIAGAGLGGGGALSADVTLTADVTTVFGRTGDVVLTGADIAAGGGVPATRQVIAGAGLSGGGDLSGDRTFAVVADTTIQRLRIAKGGALIGSRQELNLIEGSNVTLNVVDNAGANRIDVTVTASGGGGATPANYQVNGALIGTRPTLNLIAGANTTISGADNSGGNRVDITVSSAAGGSQTPWTSDIDAAGFRLINTGNVGIGITPSAPLDIYRINSSGVGPELILRNQGATAGEQARISFWGGGSARGALHWSLDVASGYGGMLDIKFGQTTDINALVSVAQFRSSQIVFSPNVGVGVVSPALKFEVSGRASITASVASALDSVLKVYNDNASANATALHVAAANNDTNNCLLYLAGATQDRLKIFADGRFMLWIGGSFKTLSVDGSGFVKAT
jgi:hypothetical protein